MLHPNQHGGRDHRGGRIFRIGASLIDHLAPHAVGVLKWGQRGDLILERSHHTAEFRMLGWEISERPRQTQRRKSVPASPSCFTQRRMTIKTIRPEAELLHE